MRPESPDDVMDMHAVRVALGNISAKTLTRLIAARRFPKPFNLTAQGRYWFRRDVDWYLWGRQIRPRMAPKRNESGTTVDNAGTTADKRRVPR